MPRMKLKILMFSILLITSNPINIGQEKISVLTTNSSQIATRQAIVNEQRPRTVELRTDRYIQAIPILCSFYTSSVHDCGNDLGISASGKNLNEMSRGGNPILVAAPIGINFGTLIEVDGLGTVQVEDRGGKINFITIGDITYMKLDIFIPGASRQQLIDKGVVKTKGYIIEKQGD